MLACSIKRYSAEFHSQSFIGSWLRSGIPGAFPIEGIRRIDIRICKAGYETMGGGKYVNPETMKTKEDADHGLPYLASGASRWRCAAEQFAATSMFANGVQD